MMALFFGLYRPNNLFYRIVLSSFYGKSCMYNEKSYQSDNINAYDSIDSFTTQLLVKRQRKWNTLRIQKKFGITENKPPESVNKFTHIESDDIRIIRKQELNDLFIQYLDKVNHTKIVDLTEQCFKYRLCPSFPILQYICSIFARNGDENKILQLQKLAEDIDPIELQEYCNFSHYLAQALWVNNKTNESLNIFYDVYKDHRYLRKRIRLILRYLISDITTERSEAVLVTTLKFCEKLVAEFNDYYLLIHIWQICFLSEWYSDQMKAAYLIDTYPKLLRGVNSRISYIIQKAFINSDPEALYRLLETLLKYKVKEHYSTVLRALFDYRYYNGDLKNCSEIIEWSLNLNIPLLYSQEMQFVDLLLNGRDLPKKLPEYKPPKIAPEFELKF